MKTTALLSALLLTSFLSMGMGYPQDMFAEHVTTKGATAKTARVVKSTQEKGSPAAKASGREKANKAAQPSAVVKPMQHTSWMDGGFQLNRLNVIAVRIFDLSTDKVNEQTVTSEVFQTEQADELPFSQLFARFQECLRAYLPGQFD